MKTGLLTAITALCLLGLSATFFGHTFVNERKAIKSESATRSMQQVSSLSCRSNVQLSLGYQGYGVLEPQMLLADQFPDYSNFEVVIVDPPIYTDTADCSMVGEQIMVEVRDTVNNIKCWSNVLVEDKLPPQTSCDTVDVSCNLDPYADNRMLFLPDLEDNCTDISSLTITYNQNQSSQGCQSDYVLIINRTWYISDESGNTTSCDQVIRLERPDIDSVEFPENDTLYCPNTDTDPTITGIPTLDGEEVSTQCGLMVWNEDNIIDKCGGSFKVMRTWNVMDWCANEQETQLQVIYILDTAGPDITCPNDTIIENEELQCYGLYTIPNIAVTDDCAEATDLVFDFYVNNVFVSQTSNIQLPEGDNSIRVVVHDGCFNYSECTYNVTVLDSETPTVTCYDVDFALPSSGDARVGPEVFNSIVYMDNCEVVDTAIRRMNSFCNDPDDLVFGEEITFCCEDVGDTIMVEVKAFDAQGNMNSCMFEVYVQDNVPPIVNCPPDETINCDELTDDLAVFGSPFIDDNCFFTVDTIVDFNLDACKEGSIFRTWVATDEFGNANSCTQTITVQNPYDFDDASITWPADTMVSECALGGISPESLNLTPEFQQTPCNTVGVGYTDMTMDPDSACLQLMRTWTVYDSCEDRAYTHVQNIQIINNAPPVLTVPNDTTLYADSICVKAASLDSAFTNDCSSGVTFTNSYTEGGALVDTVFPLGETTIIFEAIDECNNVSTDTTIVTVVDTTSPTITCINDTIVSTDMNVCEAIITIPLPETDDNCTVDSIVNDYNFTSNASDTFPIGTTTVIFTVFDGSGNSATCSFTVTVNDSVPPELTCPVEPDTLYLDSMCNVEIPDYRDSISVTDNCSSIADITLTQTPMDMTVLMGIQDTSVQIIAEDSSGNMDTCLIPIVLIDTIAPSIECPENDTLYLDENCEAVIDNYVDSAMVMSNCTQIMNVLITQSPDSGTVVSGADNIIEITLTAEDSSMNTMSCTFTLTLLDTTPPELESLNDTLVENDTALCGAFINFEVPLVSDNCIIDSFYNDYNLDSDASDFYPVGDTIVTYIVVDESGNRTVDSFTVTVVDNEGPIIDCPSDTTINCDVIADVSSTGMATATDNCDSVMAITFSDDTTAGSCMSNYTINRTFVVEDQYGNMSSCTQTITVQDTVAPIITCPPDTTIECTESLNPFNTGLPTATDNCQSNIDINFADNTTNICDGEFVITRIFTADDSCGNTSSCTQTITVIDTVAPVFDNMAPADTTISCDAAVPAPATLTATDNCSGATVTLTADTTTGSCPQEFTIMRTWIATDDCLNSRSMSQQIQIIDTVAPVFDNPAPADITVDCNAVPSIASLTATDNCGMVTIRTREDTATGACPQEYTLRRVWTAEDDCGNVDSVEQTVIVIDTSAPVFDSPAPADTTVDCDAVPMMVSLTATDNCGMVTITTSEDTTSGVCPEEYTLRRVWTAEDECGNVDSLEQIVSVIDTSAPVFDSPAPADTTVDCDAVPMMLSLTATDNCGTVTVRTREDSTSGACPQEYTLRRVWIAEDECGNVDSVDQIINVIDTAPPVFDINPMDTVVDCDAPVPTPTPMATDNCGSVTMTASSSINQGACPNEFIIDRTWTAEDECGNITTINQTVTIQDTTAPVISCPADITIECTDRADTIVTGSASATDNCENNVAITFSDDTTAGICAGEYIIARTFVADDSCGNVDSCIQNITVIDTVAPVFDNGAPADTTIDCDANVPEPATLTATDNCSGVTVTYSADTTAGICPQEFTISRTWVATDDCLNSRSVNQQIQIVDTVAPVFDSPLPADTTVDCDAVVMMPTLTATDNCGMVTITTSEDTITGICPQEYTLQRVWVAEDECGNIDSVEQIVNVIDTVPPVFDALPPSDTTIDCDAVPAPVTLTATDNCGTASVTFREDTLDGTLPVLYTLRRVWTTEDECSNIDSVDRFISVQDTTPPSLTCPLDTSLTLDSNCEIVLPDLSDGAVAMDNCSPLDSISFEQIPPAGSLITEEGDTTILIVATDTVGNSDTCSFVVTVEDLVPPSITCPTSDTVYLDALCSIEIDDYRDSAAVSDNCTDMADITISQNPDSGTIFNFEGDTTIVIQLIATDLSGNMDTCEFNVVARDTTPPSISCPDDITLFADDSCKAIIPDLTDSVVIADNCDPDMTVTATQSPSPGDILMGEQTIAITFTVTDMGGQTQTCQVSLTVEDMTPPTVICPPDTQLIADSMCQVTIPDLTGESQISDNCTDSVDLVITQNPAADSVISTMDGDTIKVTITVQDSSGNIDSCMLEIEVIDTLPPSLICTGDTLTVNLDEECEGVIPDVTPEIVVLDDNCLANPDITVNQVPAAGTPFSIVDPPLDTNVVITVVDASGNSSTCSVLVRFIDVTPPMITCPNDTIVDCEFDFDGDLDALLGVAVASDNCSSVTISISENEDRDLIGNCVLVDTLRRIFTATDESGNSVSCTQIVTTDGDLVELDSTDFLFTDSIFLGNCENIEPEDIPSTIPTVDPNVMACNNVGYIYTDSVNQNPTIACIEIFRTFIVTDSCYFDPNTGEGQFEFEQYLIIEDTVPPGFTVPTQDTMVYLDSCGTVDVFLDAVTASDCSGIDTIYNDSEFAFDTTGGNVSGAYPFGIHNVNVFAMDSCGNLDSTAIQITVTDSFPDTLTCNFKIINNLDSNALTAVFISHEFFGSYVDSCGNPPLGDVTTSYDPMDLGDTIQTINCDSIDTMGGGNFIKQDILYVFLDGMLVDSCDIELGIENPELCDTMMNIIAGQIVTARNIEFKDAEVVVSNESMSKMRKTDKRGLYLVEHLYPDRDYLVDPNYEGDPRKGVSTFDMLLIMRHILELDRIEDPYFNVAADVDKSKSISGADLIHLRKLLLRMTDELPVDNWRFIAENYEFSDPEYACREQYREKMWLSLSRDVKGVNFIGTKVGDVDGSIEMQAEGRSAPTILNVKASEANTVELTSSRTDMIYGFQLSIKADQTGRPQIIDGSIEFSHKDYRILENGDILITWLTPYGLSVEEGDVLFSIQGVNTKDLKNSIQLNPSDLSPEAYWNGEGSPSTIEFRYQSDQYDEMALYQNIPNPWNNRTLIPFSLKEKENVVLTILNASGKQVYESRIEGTAGYNEVPIRTTDLEGPGIYYYQLDGETFRASKKMIVLQ